MTRRTLIAAADSAAGRCGYSFYTGFSHRMNTDLGELPALWLLPPKIETQEGHAEGIRSYEVTLYLIENCRYHSASGKEKQWETMEMAATRICKAMGKEVCVKNIEDIECTPAEFNLTNRGEISLAVKFKANMNFITEKED